MRQWKACQHCNSKCKILEGFTASKQKKVTLRIIIKKWYNGKHDKADRNKLIKYFSSHPNKTVFQVYQSYNKTLNCEKNYSRIM